MTRRPIVRLLTAALMGVALLAPLTGTAQAAPRFPDRIELPDNFRPEGITIGSRPVAYLGSRFDGDIVALDLRTGARRLVSEGPGEGNPSIGLKIDRRQQRLFVAGGTTGTGRVVDVRTGTIERTYAFASGVPTFVNDVVLTRSAAWFTDSRQARLYRVAVDRQGRPAPGFSVLPLSGDWVQDTTEGVNNANGIAETPDRRALLVVQSNTGFLFRVDPRTGVARRVDLGGLLLTNGDGLLVRGRTLYAVQNRLNQVAVVTLNRAGTSGRLNSTITSPDFDIPTTVAAFGRSLYLPNARFSTPPTPTTPYWVTRIDRR